MTDDLNNHSLSPLNYHKSAWFPKKAATITKDDESNFSTMNLIWRGVPGNEVGRGVKNNYLEKAWRNAQRSCTKLEFTIPTRK